MVVFMKALLHSQLMFFFLAGIIGGSAVNYIMDCKIRAAVSDATSQFIVYVPLKDLSKMQVN